MIRSVRLLVLTTLLGATAVACDPDPKGPVVEEKPYIRPGVWWKIEPEGKVCSNGSQYKFFVNLARESDDVIIVLEPGGACWDYESCSGAMGIRGAANPDGIPDNHMDLWKVGLPLIRRDPGSPTENFNLVFVPYCTGDIHSGNKDMEYEGPQGEKLVYRHRGAENVRAVGEWVRDRFDGKVGTLFVTGCSAGGAGSIANYYFLRHMFDHVERGVLLDDAGPIFPGKLHSGPLHAKVRESWDVDSLLDQLPEAYAERMREDFGNINALLAEEFPNDRLSNVFFRLDYNYSLYSYERFHEDVLPDPVEENDEYRRGIYGMWWDDTKELLALSDEYPNLGYYIPFYRDFNDSHCATILTWGGTEMEVDGGEMNLLDFIDELLYGEGEVPGYVETGPEGMYGDLAPHEPWPPQ